MGAQDMIKLLGFLDAKIEQIRSEMEHVGLYEQLELDGQLKAYEEMLTYIKELLGHYR